MIVSLQFLRTYIGCLLANEWSSRRPWWSGGVSIVLLLPTSATSAYLLPPRLVDRTCTLHLVELYLFRRADCGGTVKCRALSGPTTWNSLPPALRGPELSQNAFAHALKTHLFRHHRDVSTRFRGAEYKCTDWLTYLFTYLLTAWRACCAAGRQQRASCVFYEISASHTVRLRSGAQCRRWQTSRLHCWWSPFHTAWGRQLRL